MPQAIHERLVTNPAATLDGTELCPLSQADVGVVATIAQLKSWFFPSGAGSPEGAVTRPVGYIYRQDNVGLWVKESGAGNTGWVQHTSIE